MTTSLLPVIPGGSVLVVDDSELNRELLRGVLEAKGFIVRTADAGSEELIARIRSEPPDVVLLDVMMPGINGIELCRRLKLDPATAHLPVLLVTSLSDRSARLHGIAAGANEFLVKPIDTQDVVLRVRNALRTKRLMDDLKETLERLRLSESMRDNLVHMLVHDLRTPLFAIQSYLEPLHGGDAGRIGADPELREDVHKAFTVASAMLEMIGTILDVSRIEAGSMPLALEVVDLAALAREAADTIDPRAFGARLSLPGPGVEAWCDRTLVRRVFTNLIGNALKHAGSGRLIEVRAERGIGGVTAAVVDHGAGVGPEAAARIFEKFGSQDPSKRHSTGLGLPFCKLAVEAHGGRIGVESAPGAGSRFWFTLPHRAPMPPTEAAHG